MSDREGVEHRVDGYFDAIVTMALRGALAGTSGSWSDVAARAEKASRRWRRTQACHPALHAHFLEFELWNQLFGACVLPDRHGMLAAAIHRIGAEEAGGDFADVDVLLGVVCPEDHPATGARARQKPSLEELAVLRQLLEAERRRTVSALDSAFRATVFFADTLGEDTGAGHPKCEAWPVLTVRRVLTRSLWETMPTPHRRVLARLAQLLYFQRHAPEEREPLFFDQTPELHVPQDADPRWSFDPAWRFIPNIQRGEEQLDPEPEAWLVKDMEAAVRGQLEETSRRRREVDRKLALLTANRRVG